MEKNKIINFNIGHERFIKPGDPAARGSYPGVKESGNISQSKRVLYFSSIALVIIYAASSVMAFVFYTRPFSPLRNWLSDLGNKVLNPAGCIFYNTGVLITALLLFLFFMNFNVLRSTENKVQKLMVFLTQIFGVLGAISLAFSGIYSIDIPAPHSLWSAGFYISLGTAFAFSVAALQYETGCPLSLLVLGVLTVTIDCLVSLFFSSKPIFEWITVALFLSYLVFLGKSMDVPANRSFGKRAAR